MLNSIKVIETKKINNTNNLSMIIYNNFKYLENFPTTMHTVENINKTLNDENLLAYLVYYNNTMIGYLIGNFQVLPDQRYCYYISYFYVLEKYRNKKIGSYLMNKMINKCKSLGVKFIVLTFDTHDEKLVKFYKRYNFILDPNLKTNNRHEVYCLFL